jgi:hypothetical protein
VITRRSVVIGTAAGLAMAGVFAAVVAGTAGWAHLDQQVRADWWLLAPLLAGFATQVALMVELRHRHRLASAAAVSVGAGASVSGAGMLACCAHHAVELAPLAGLSGAATFLTDVQRPLMTAGVALNVVAVIMATRKLAEFRPAVTNGAACPA